MEPAPTDGNERKFQDRRGSRDPGEAPEKCSGRTATMLLPRGNSGSATGTEVPRPAGPVRAARPGTNQPDEAPTGSGPRRAPPPPTGGGGSGACDRGRSVGSHGVPPVPSGTGWAGAPGPRRGLVVEPGAGPGADGSPGSGSERGPHGSGSGCVSSDGTARRVEVERQERLRGVDRFAGRLLGAVSASGLRRPASVRPRRVDTPNWDRHRRARGRDRSGWTTHPSGKPGAGPATRPMGLSRNLAPPFRKAGSRSGDSANGTQPEPRPTLPKSREQVRRPGQ